jgi:hypothetical protein
VIQLAVAARAGALARLEMDRLGRFVLLGNLLGMASGAVVLTAGLTGLLS